MHRTSNLNKFQDSYQVLEKNLGLCLMEKKKSSKTHKKCINNFFQGPKLLPPTPSMLMCMKCINVTRTKCPIAM